MEQTRKNVGKVGLKKCDWKTRKLIGA